MGYPKWVNWLLYIQMFFSVDGTAEYGQAIRWLYLFGHFGKDPKAEKKLDKLDYRNFKKWKKINGKEIKDYLEVARV